MVDRSSSDVRSAPDWRRRLLGVGLIVFGATIVIDTGADYYDAWSTARTWNASPEAALLAQQVAEPTPIWQPPATPEPLVAPIEPLWTGLSRAAKDLTYHAVKSRYSGSWVSRRRQPLWIAVRSEIRTTIASSVAPAA